MCNAILWDSVYELSLASKSIATEHPDRTILRPLLAEHIIPHGRFDWDLETRLPHKATSKKGSSLNPVGSWVEVLQIIG